MTTQDVTQIINLLMLAPEIQEEILFLPRAESGRDQYCLRNLQQITGLADWRQQFDSWSATF